MGIKISGIPYEQRDGLLVSIVPEYIIGEGDKFKLRVLTPNTKKTLEVAILDTNEEAEAFYQKWKSKNF